ncbi:ATP-binding protein [Aquibacillus salsiterrae]|uniref:histidine kinase n=1 Tax=Aquibacillus salsiterrae TaxID=2950439 RepID=A0A9X4AE98_9BACI|nr:ATP-binding protein [Aquibacillus salsiterrae]MDC3416289.1 ATP-binding protein [Aquibacillus salsiterrae]
MSDHIQNNQYKEGPQYRASAGKQINFAKLSDLPKCMLNWVEDHAFDLIIVCDSLGRILYVSKSVSKLLGYKRDVLIGDQALNYLPYSDQLLIKARLKQQATKSTKIIVSVRDVYGKNVWIETYISAMQNEEMGEKLFVSLATDITDKKEAEEMLIRSEKMSVAGQLAAGVAHEIRNPLTSLKGFVHLLQSGIEQKSDYYKIMVDEIEKIETITSELLFISKPMTDEKSKVSLSEMLSDVVTLLRSQATIYNIQINIKMEKDVILYCDKTQMKQVLINLIKNAVEEMGNGGTIQVIVSSEEKHVFISIVDEGPGIPDDILHKLKEPFFTTKKDGTGLGLMISNKIVENHNGAIDMMNNRDIGSTFRIRLPIDG